MIPHRETQNNRRLLPVSCVWRCPCLRLGASVGLQLLCCAPFPQFRRSDCAMTFFLSEMQAASVVFGVCLWLALLAPVAWGQPYTYCADPTKGGSSCLERRFQLPDLGVGQLGGVPLNVSMNPNEVVSAACVCFVCPSERRELNARCVLWSRCGSSSVLWVSPTARAPAYVPANPSHSLARHLNGAWSFLFVCSGSCTSMWQTSSRVSS